MHARTKFVGITKFGFIEKVKSKNHSIIHSLGEVPPLPERTGVGGGAILGVAGPGSG